MIKGGKGYDSSKTLSTGVVVGLLGLAGHHSQGFGNQTHTKYFAEHISTKFHVS